MVDQQMLRGNTAAVVQFNFVDHALRKALAFPNQEQARGRVDTARQHMPRFQFFGRDFPYFLRQRYYTRSPDK